jgi:thiaminase/transcriptional activator TenA
MIEIEKRTYREYHELNTVPATYHAWIAMYESDEFQGAMNAEIQWLNDRLKDVSPKQFEQLTRIFRDATRLEIDFWEMGMTLSD